MAGSITLTGGHGTGAAWAKVFGEVNNIQGAMEVAMACATFGLIPRASWPGRWRTF